MCKEKPLEDFQQGMDIHNHYSGLWVKNWPYICNSGDPLESSCSDLRGGRAGSSNGGGEDKWRDWLVLFFF